MIEEQRKLALLIANQAIKLAGEKGVALAIMSLEMAEVAACAQVKLVGRAMAADCFRQVAAKIERGAFDLATAGGDSTRLN